ncbi:hypothetical protein CVT26_002608 [Gymnopilus dilepis]|uniref:Uncharacterized protein n=1 Tax=Gymnopilus dilepis TaxID=231916 RepID=A0A409VF59_9AGAR|nr:hypothetical protein CVT26_002608 [Gymnopilus dilepis]
MHLINLLGFRETICAIVPYADGFDSGRQRIVGLARTTCGEETSAYTAGEALPVWEDRVTTIPASPSKMSSDHSAVQPKHDSQGYAQRLQEYAV